MRVLAAAFEDPAVARMLLEELRRRYGLRAADASIAPLGTGGRLPSRTVLAGRFSDSLVPEIRAMVVAHGGQVVSEVDEQWTRSSFVHESRDPDTDNRTH